MRRMLAVACAIAFALPAAATATAAAEKTSNEQTEEKAAEQPKERLICRRLETTGSRTRKEKVCMTREQWREADRQPGF